MILEFCAWKWYCSLWDELCVIGTKQTIFREITGTEKQLVRGGCLGFFFSFTRVFVGILGQTVASNDTVLFHHDMLL